MNNPPILVGTSGQWYKYKSYSNYSNPSIKFLRIFQPPPIYSSPLIIQYVGVAGTTCGQLHTLQVFFARPGNFLKFQFISLLHICPFFYISMHEGMVTFSPRYQLGWRIISHKGPLIIYASGWGRRERGWVND